MPNYRRKKTQRRNKGNNNKGTKLQGKRQTEEKKLGKSNENATGTSPEIEEEGNIDSDRTQTAERSLSAGDSEDESKIAGDKLSAHDSEESPELKLTESFANFSDSCEVTEFSNAVGDFISKTGTKNSSQRKAGEPSSVDEENLVSGNSDGNNEKPNVENSSVSGTLSQSSSDSETLKPAEESPDREISETTLEENDSIPDLVDDNLVRNDDSEPLVTVDIIIQDDEDVGCASSSRETDAAKKSTPVKYPIVTEVITTLYSYRVESPKPIRPKTASIKKSRSLDDDEIMIQEMSDNSTSSDITDNQPLISEAESEADSETAETVEKSDSRIVSITTLPLDSAEAEAIKSQEFTSSKTVDSQITESQDFKARRAKKRAALESHFFPQFLNPRYLDSIKEENSDVSDIERKSDSLDNVPHAPHPLVRDLSDDDVFIDNEVITKKANAVFPKSNLDFSQRKKHVSSLRPPKTGVIREEPPCLVVEAKIVEQESIEESCSTWTNETVQESNAAEIVYIDSASSSSSDLLDLDYTQDNDADVEDSHEETDVYIETPTIEVENENIFRNSPTPTCENSTSTESGEKLSASTPVGYEKDDRNEISEIENNFESSIVSCDHRRNYKQSELEEAEQIPEQLLSENQTACSEESRNNNNSSECEQIETDFKVGEPCSDNMFASSLNPLISDKSDASKFDNISKEQVDESVISNISSKELVRQDSSGSHGSGQSQSTVISQCTAINKDSLTHSDLADFDVSSCISGSTNTLGQQISTDTAVKSLRQLCIEALASMPYGKVVLEELASVAESLSKLTHQHQKLKTAKEEEMPYPVPVLPEIKNLEIHEKNINGISKAAEIKLMTVPPGNGKPQQPPPVPERPKENSWLGVPTEEDPNVLVCLSPSQQNYLKESKTLTERSADTLLDMHKKFVERRGYHELTAEQVNVLNRGKSQEIEKVVSTSQLRNSVTPPPVPPPPLPEALGKSDTTVPNDDRNNHRLLAIIRDSKQSSSENSSRNIEQVEKPQQSSVSKNYHTGDQETQTIETTTSKTTTTSSGEQKTSTVGPDSKMHQSSLDQENFFKMLDNENPFKTDTKRYSNIETPFCSQIMQTMPKRYSNIETSSYESRKRIENGQVVYDFCDSNKEKFTDSSDNKKDGEIGSSSTNVKSDAKLETNFRSTKAPSSQKDQFSQSFINRRTDNEKSTSTSTDDFSYNEFRQRAKESAKRAKSEFFASDKLFKDFDEMSKFFDDDRHTSRSEMKSDKSRIFEIPINLEDKASVWEEFDKKMKHEKQLREKADKVYNIPITIEGQQNKTKSERKTVQSENIKKEIKDSRKREEKIVNIPIKLEGNQKPFSPNDAFSNHIDSPQLYDQKLSERRLSSQNLEEWMKYAELGASSENITKPFMKEMEICHGLRGNVRAPRLTASTSNLNTYGRHDEFQRSYESYQSLPKRQRYMSCNSMIDQTPITQYVTPHFARRSSLPREIHDPHMDYIKQKEQELRAEFEKLESDRRRLIEEMDRMHSSRRLSKDSQQNGSCRLPTLSEEEAFRQQMHNEWMSKVAEREERRLHKIIKISKPSDELGTGTSQQSVRKSSSTADISDEFLRRVKERRSKLCMPSDSDWESGAESQPTPSKNESNDKSEPSVKVIEGLKEADFKQLPKHLREFAEFTNKFQEEHREELSSYEKSNFTKKEGVWSPGNKSETITTSETKTEKQIKTGQTTPTPPTPPPLPIWSPQPSPTPGRKEFRPVKFESPVLPRRYVRQDSAPVAPPWSDGNSRPFLGYQSSSCSNINSVGTEKRVFSSSSEIAQKFKETPVGKGASYTETERPKIPKDDSPAFVRPNEVIYSVKHEYMSEPESENDRPKKMAQLGRRQFEGIGPTTKDGMPIVLRSEVKENNQHQWYKRMYNTLHKAKDSDDYVTIRYKTHRGRYPYKSNGYMSEPEPSYYSDYSTMKYNTLDRKRTPSTGTYHDDRYYGTMPNPVKSGSGSYKNQPGRIEDYIPGHSSVSEKEKKEWWDEVMEIFDGHLEQQKLSSNYAEGYLSRALKEQGYESDSNLVFRKKEESKFAPLSPVEQKQAYRNVQAGGEPPLQGFRKPAPEKPKESPHRYFESDVNIHYKTPIRYEYKEAIPEEELARRQAETMKKLYQEERRRKYLQELQDMNSRRHTDNFTPSQKSPIPLNRYDDFNADLSPKSPISSTYPRTVARALYNFQGQTARELTFKKGDVIYIRRQVDKNWYEGEHNAMIGLLPANYVEIISKDGVRQPLKKPSEGQARAKFNFQAQSAIELSLNKGELVTLTRRVDENWFEGKIANRKGIFPVSYVEVLTDIGAEDYITPTQNKPVGTPASHSLITYPNTSSLDSMRTNVNNEYNTITNGHPGVVRETKTVQKTEVLTVDTNSEPIAYRALYKYRPQNNDELELQEGDIVYVLEKCDDGWYVGTSQRTGYFGTFPGNYVERV